MSQIESKITPGIFLAQLFSSRDVMHLAHLQTKVFAEHKILNEYYDTLLNMVDEFAESYFGKYGRCEIKLPSSNYINPEAHLKQLSSYIEANRTVFKDSYIQSQLDNMLQLIYKTLYLITLL